MGTREPSRCRTPLFRAQRLGPALQGVWTRNIPPPRSTPASGCFGPLEVAYDYDAIARVISREKIAAGPAKPVALLRSAFPSRCDPSVDLGTGFTPLVRGRPFGRRARAR